MDCQRLELGRLDGVRGARTRHGEPDRRCAHLRIGKRRHICLARRVGFIDGRDVFNLLSVDTTDNIFHAAIGGLGLVLGLVPKQAHRTAKVGGGRTTASHPPRPHGM